MKIEYILISIGLVCFAIVIAWLIYESKNDQ